jgi:WD40 repeat protein
MTADAQSIISSAYLSSLVSFWKLDDSRQLQLLRTVGGEEKRDSEGYDGLWLAPDGHSLVMHRLNNLYIQDLRSKKITHICRNHTNRVYTVAFSRDGKLMASGSNDRTVCIWDLATGQLLHCVAAHKNEISAVAFSPDGRTLVSGDEDGVIVFSHVNTGRILFETQIEEGQINDLEFSPDGESLAVAQPNDLILLCGARDTTDDAP